MRKHVVTDRERPDIDSQEKACLQQFVIGNDDAGMEASVESRSFVNRVNAQVRKTKNVKCYRKQRKHSMIW